MDRAPWPASRGVGADVRRLRRPAGDGAGPAGDDVARGAFDDAPVAMAMVGLGPQDSGRYLRVNAAFATMVGWCESEVTGLTVPELTVAEDRERDARKLAGLLNGEVQVLAFEKRFRHRTGHVVPAWLTTSILRDPGGRPAALLQHALDLTDRQRTQAQLQQLALTDPLTGLANSTLLADRLDLSLARLQRTGGLTAMFLLDVDRFTTVNDAYGHRAGDAVLVEIARRLEAVNRAHATVSRVGGNSFVVLVEGLAAAIDVVAVADRLLGALRRPYALGAPGATVRATVSMGVSVAGDATRTAGAMHREADLALHRAKDSGRDRYAVFDDALRIQAERRSAAESSLRQVLADRRLVAVFAPIVSLSDGRIQAADVLARIKDGDRLLSPSEPIDGATGSGLTVEVDAQLFERATAECARLIDSGTALRRLHSRVSPRSLADPAFVTRMSKALVWHGVPASMVRVEVTGTSLLDDSAAVRTSLAQIKELGIQIGLVGFGVAGSALAHLEHPALHFVAIDRALVERLGNPRGAALARAVIDLAHAYNLVVGAEDVRTEHQLATLREMGCDWARGDLLGQPMGALDLDALATATP